MRTTMTALALALLLASAGCVAKDDDAGSGDNATAPTTPILATPPAPIEDSKTISGGADPLNNVPGQAPCATPGNQCQRYPFTVNTTTTMTAALTWGVPANDFDLYVFEGGAPLSGPEGATSPPGTAEALEMELDAGDYELVVVPWSVGQDTYTVSATFA